MVRVNGEQVNFNKEINRDEHPKTINNNVDVQLRDAFGTNEQVENNSFKKLKANDLDFTGFPKANRQDAALIAERSLNEVRDMARVYNANYPNKPYIANENDFPRPEEFSQKNYGGKDGAYNAWKVAVTEWVEDAKQDMNAKSSANIADLGATLDMYTEEINSKLDRNYFANEIAEGVTRDFIVETYIELKGNLNAVETAVRKEAARIRAEVQDTEDNIKREIESDGDLTRGKIDSTQEELTNTIKKEAKTSQQISSLSDAISNAINGVKSKSFVNPSIRVHTERTVQKVEKLKQQIIGSSRINENEKIRLLTKLRDLVIRDNWITTQDLDKISEEVSRIRL